MLIAENWLRRAIRQGLMRRVLKEGVGIGGADFQGQIITTGVVEAFYLFLTEAAFESVRTGIWAQAEFVKKVVDLINQVLESQTKSDLVTRVKSLLQLLITPVDHDKSKVVPILESAVFKRLLANAKRVKTSFDADMSKIIAKKAYFERGDDCIVIVNHLESKKYSGLDTLWQEIDLYTVPAMGIKASMQAVITQYLRGDVPELTKEDVVKGLKTLLPIIDPTEMSVPEVVTNNEKKVEKSVSSVKNEKETKVKEEGLDDVEEVEESEQETGVEPRLFKIPKLPKGYYDLYQVLLQQTGVKKQGHMSSVQSLRKLYQDKFLFIGDEIDLNDVVAEGVVTPKIYSYKLGGQDVFEQRPTVEEALRKIRAGQSVKDVKDTSAAHKNKKVTSPSQNDGDKVNDTSSSVTAAKEDEKTVPLLKQIDPNEKAKIVKAAAVQIQAIKKDPNLEMEQKQQEVQKIVAQASAEIKKAAVPVSNTVSKEVPVPQEKKTLQKIKDRRAAKAELDQEKATEKKQTEVEKNKVNAVQTAKSGAEIASKNSNNNQDLMGQLVSFLKWYDFNLKNSSTTALRYDDSKALSKYNELNLGSNFSNFVNNYYNFLMKNGKNDGSFFSSITAQQVSELKKLVAATDLGEKINTDLVRYKGYESDSINKDDKIFIYGLIIVLLREFQLSNQNSSFNFYGREESKKYKFPIAEFLLGQTYGDQDEIKFINKFAKFDFISKTTRIMSDGMRVTGFKVNEQKKFQEIDDNKIPSDFNTHPVSKRTILNKDDANGLYGFPDYWLNAGIKFDGPLNADMIKKVTSFSSDMKNVLNLNLRVYDENVLNHKKKIQAEILNFIKNKQGKKILIVLTDKVGCAPCKWISGPELFNFFTDNPDKNLILIEFDLAYLGDVNKILNEISVNPGFTNAGVPRHFVCSIANNRIKKVITEIPLPGIAERQIANLKKDKGYIYSIKDRITFYNQLLKELQ
jgi:hypothetical protein